MDSSQITLVALIAVPIVFLMALRINAALVFLSLCLGDVLVQFASNDASSTLTAMGIHLGAETVKLFLLAVPTVLTTIFMIRTVKMGSRLLINVFPAAGVGFLGALLIVPLLPPGTTHNVTNSALWTQVQNAQVLIVTVSTLMCLLVLWLQRPKAGEGKHGKKHH
ncbi:MAG TPA: hypothetical protein VFI84_02080 [Candidatus Saccharimonadales bacterium]|nr:hypothetical protein [Candidatus Saccharimonadales bacterium]